MLKDVKCNYDKHILDFVRNLLRNIKIVYINVEFLYMWAFLGNCKEILRKIYTKEQFFI